MASSDPNHISETSPPKTITLGSRIPRSGFGGDTFSP